MFTKSYLERLLESYIAYVLYSEVVEVVTEREYELGVNVLRLHAHLLRNVELRVCVVGRICLPSPVADHKERKIRTT